MTCFNSPRFEALALCVALISIVSSARADWPAGDIPICVATNYQSEPNVVPDGSGGVIIGWLDPRTGYSSTALYGQRIDANGSPMWTSDGVYLQRLNGSNVGPTYMVGDGNGGMIYVWVENNDVFAQHIDSTGVADWNPDTLWGFAQPVPVCTDLSNQSDAQIAEDGAGGVIVAWTDSRGSSQDIYAQRVDASGIPQWTTDGVAVCTAPYWQNSASISADGLGGAFLAWTDVRANSWEDIYAQRIDASGNSLWTTDGVMVSEGPPGTLQDVMPTIVADGTGGAIVAWRHTITTPTTSIYAQARRLGGSGALLWNRAIGISPERSTNGWEVAAPGDGGLISVWSDSRDQPTNGADLYVTRVDSTGGATWADSSGIALCTEPGHQQTQSIAMDDVGVAWVTWGDRRSGSIPNLYSQQIDPSGAFLGAASGDSLDINPWAQKAVLSPIPGSGIVAVYTDRRDGNDDVFAKMLVVSTPSAVRPVTTPHLALSANWPNPFGPTTSVPYSVETDGPVDLAVYDVAGRRVRTLVHGTVGRGQRFATWDGTNDRGRRVSSGVYFVRLRAGTTVISRRMTLLK